MKKHAKILSLFIALFMLLALALPTLAYETDGLFNTPLAGGLRNVPADEWVVSTVYHWVVRGDTLAGIAAAYGTYVDLIIENNWDYFGDLGLRNQTYYGNRAAAAGIELEHGVRLKIYDVITVRHYVVRGDTLNDLANGKLWWFNFQLFTTVDAIRNENAGWFRNLDLLNITQDEYVPLVESNNIFAHYFGFVINGFPSRYDGWTVYGSPLYITVPINYYYDNNWPWIGYDTWTHLRDYSETIPGGFADNRDWENRTYPGGNAPPLNPLMNAQIVFGNVVPLRNPIYNYNVGWTLNQALLDFNFVAYQLRIEPLWIPFFGEHQPWQNYVSLRK